jgi:hypothetical protein
MSRGSLILQRISERSWGILVRLQASSGCSQGLTQTASRLLSKRERCPPSFNGKVKSHLDY